MNVELLVLQVLPDKLPGLRQSSIRDKIQARINKGGGQLPSKADIRDALQRLRKKRLVHSERRVDDSDGFPYHVYWRDPSYVPPLYVEVHA